MTKFCKCIKFLKCQCQKEQGFQNNLEMYKILYQAYADEIKNLWQRSIFLGAFMTLAWGGYGALQLNFIENGKNEKFFIDMYHCGSIALCAVIIVLSLLWIAMAKGSKLVQEAHEEHINDLKFDEIDNKRLFCNLNDYEYPKSKINAKTGQKEMNENLKSSLFFRCGTTQAYRYSPSKINIALGWLSCFISFSLIGYHIGFAIDCSCMAIVAIVILFATMAITTSIIGYFLKGGDKDEKMCLVKFLKLICVIK